ncbi:MAG TPA: malto-oligosyltrehalose trehalohydrolase [Acidimicrobiia bacterium]|nr:malto-oligosyltrehalose trehalohydrolase [Acidimicrobiia bacterium]
MKPSVWAPYADHVDVVVGDKRVGMSRQEKGWWHADVELLPGDSYAFSLDQGTPLPDPRSRFQPDGVHGPSRVIELSSDSDGAWSGFDLKTAVIYEMHVGTFTRDGTFEGAIKRLDHLVDLGVDALEVMPVNQFSGRHGWGYDGVDLFAVHDTYGGPEGFRRFIEACHDRGVGVLLDVVYNHLGPVGNYLGSFGPYFTDAYQTPWGDAINLDGPGSDEVRRFFIDNACMWLRDYGVDGLRLDAVHAFVDRSAVHFLEELANEVNALERRLGRRLWLIAESDLNDPRLLWSRAEGGYELDAAWSDDFHHSLHVALTGEQAGYYQDFDTLGDLATALRSVYVYAGRYSPSRDRRHGRPVTGLAGDRFIGYAQNHDQVGNRARGERIGHLVDQPHLYVAAALVMTAPFVPMLFQGEEWGASSPFLYFSDHEDPEIGEAVRRGRRDEFAAFGWEPEQIPDPQDRSTYAASMLRWEETDASPSRDLLRWYRLLIQLRHDTPDLNGGRLDEIEVVSDDEDRTLVMRRGSFVLAANLSDADRDLDLPGHPIQLGPASVALLELISFPGTLSAR